MIIRFKTYRFYWRDGRVEEAIGFNLASAFRSLGYGANVAKNLERWEEVKCKTTAR
jgi:hypothetical protein